MAGIGASRSTVRRSRFWTAFSTPRTTIAAHRCVPAGPSPGVSVHQPPSRWPTDQEPREPSTVFLWVRGKGTQRGSLSRGSSFGVTRDKWGVDARNDTLPGKFPSDPQRTVATVSLRTGFYGVITIALGNWYDNPGSLELLHGERELRVFSSPRFALRGFWVIGGWRS